MEQTDYLQEKLLNSVNQCPGAAFCKAAVEQLKEDIAEAEKNFQDKRMIDKLKADGIAEIEDKLQTIYTAESEKARMMLERFEQAYRKEISRDSNRQLAELKETETHYGSLDDKKLSEHIQEIIKNNKILFKSLEGELILKELRTRGNTDDYQRISEHFERNDSLRPWLQTEAGRRWKARHDFYAQAERGYIQFVWNGDGKRAITKHRLSDLFR